MAEDIGHATEVWWVGRPLSRNDFGQVVYTRDFASSSLIWYRSEAGDALWLGI